MKRLLVSLSFGLLVRHKKQFKDVSSMKQTRRMTCQSGLIVKLIIIQNIYYPVMNLAASSSHSITDAEGGMGTGLGQLRICPSLVPPPQRLFSREMCLSIGPAPLVVHSIPPTLAVDNDLQLLEVETLWGDGTLSPTGQLRANTAGTPGPLWNTTPSITATVTTLKLKPFPLTLVLCSFSTENSRRGAILFCLAVL